jgi:hypothetical protein
MIRKNLFIISFFLGTIFQSINASEQYPDILIYDGNEYEIGAYPMEDYFEIYPNRRPNSIGQNSALKRGYRAKYEIINNELILIYIETMKINGDWKKVSDKYFNNKIKIDAFTGKINLFNGERTGVYTAFTPIYEKYKILDINKGNCVDVYDINCYEYLQSLIQSFQKESYEYEYFTKKLEELNKRDK